MEGRWAQLTLSAYYDNAGHHADLSRDDDESMLREHLLLCESARRRALEFQAVKAAATAGMTAAVTEPQKVIEALFGIMSHCEKVQYPWIAGKPAAKRADNQDYVEYYNRVMAKFKKQQEHYGRRSANR